MTDEQLIREYESNIRLGQEEGVYLPVKPVCRLTGTDGNAFSIIGAVSRCLKDAGMADRAKEWTNAAMACGSYDELLTLSFSYVDAR